MASVTQSTLATLMTLNIRASRATT